MTEQVSTESHPHPNYTAVFIALMVLFLVSVGAAFLGSPVLAAAAALVVATAKALLVVLYFMHLRYEPLWIAVIFWFCLFFVLAMFIGMIPDIVYVYGG